MSGAADKVHRLRLFLLLAAFSGGVYMLAYRALIQSGDTRRALDAVTSVVRYGDWLMDETSWEKLPFRIRESSALPLGEYRVEERLQILLAAPLLKLAEIVPRLGNIHTVWLFNVIVSALSVGLVYLILRALSYADVVALAVAIGAGLGANLWAYSQTFFREPLAAFFVLCALFALQLGQGKRIGGRLASWLAAAIAMFLAYHTKFSALLALPALVVFALPSPLFGHRRTRPIALAAIFAPIAVMAFFMLVDPLPPALQDLFAGRGFHTDYLGAALRAYILSPGVSVWATAPLLLLTFAGGLWLWREGRARLLIAVIWLGAGYSLGHALLTGAHWFGGLSWPPRFLLPCVPVLMLATAPVAERMFAERRNRLRLLWIALLCYGIWIQFVGVSLSWRRFGESLPPEALGHGEWAPSLTQPRYFRWFVLPSRWGDIGFELLWTRADLPHWGYSFALYAAVVAAVLWRNVRHPRGRWRHLAPLLALLGIPLALLNIASAYDKDPRTQSGQRALHEALDFLSQSAEPGDVLLLPGADYGGFILNHVKSAAPRPIILRRPIAQAASDKQPALVVSANPNDWFDVQSFRTIQHVAGRGDRLWLLANTSPFMTWSFRPLERYLAQHYFPLREVNLAETDLSVRLLEYSARGAAPNPMTPYAGETLTSLRYGDEIRLIAFTLPNGLSYAAGEALELSLLWQAEARPEHDYTAAWFLVDSRTGAPIAQGKDSAPQDGFAPTSSWKPNWPVRDNRALRIPGGTAAGEYQIWLLLYRFGGGGEIIRLPVGGGDTAEGSSIGVLPLALAVR